MSKKNEPKSHLPDQFQVTDGINYGLDGFQFDTEMGGGVLDRARLPETKGLSALPEDMVAISEGSKLPSLEKCGSDDLLGDLSEMMGENSLAELGWLHGEQDPDRLPKNPVDRGIMELEQQWSVGNATNGIIPNRDKEIVDFERSLQEDNSKKASEDFLTEIVHHAHRKSAMGYPIEDIISECETRLGGDTSLIKDDLDLIREEHGLAGNVFVYASAFPGIQNGKWKKLLKKLGCRYLVGGDKSLSSFTNLKIVDEVNWKNALKHYEPRLRLEGRKFAGGLSAKETLRLAFLSNSTDLSPSLMDEIKPVEKKIVDTISRREAFEQLPNLKTEREVLDNTERDINKLRRQARVQLAKWVKSNLLTREQGVELGKSNKHPREVLRTASEIISASRGMSEYSGGNNQLSRNLSDRNLENANRRSAKERIEFENMLKQQMRFAKEQIGRWVSQNLLSKKNAEYLISNATDGESLLRKASDFVSRSQVQERQYNHSGNHNIDSMVERNLSTQSAIRNREYEQGKKLAASHSEYINSQIKKWSKQGLLSKSETKKILSADISDTDKLRVASGCIANRMKKAQVIHAPKTKVATYSGNIETQHIEERKQVDVESETKKANTSKLKKATSWIRRQMCEGMIGTSLTQLIGAKFSSVFLQKHEEDIKQVRKAHEGLSGHIYVDADAYASDTGTKGCEKGALIHRANKVACVKAMKRCSTCVFANRNANGDLVCQKYNKPLIENLPVENIEEYQQEMIRMANASDAEQTASLFAPTYNASEYSLGNNALNNFDYEDETFEGNLDGVFFGGLEIE